MKSNQFLNLPIALEKKRTYHRKLEENCNEIFLTITIIMYEQGQETQILIRMATLGAD